MQVKIDWEYKDEDGKTILEIVNASPAYRALSIMLNASYMQDQLQAVKEKERSLAQTPSPLEVCWRSVRKIAVDEKVQKRLYPIYPVLGNVLLHSTESSRFVITLIY